MSTFFVKLGRKALCFEADCQSKTLPTIYERLSSKEIGLDKSDYFVLCGGLRVDSSAEIKHGDTYHIIERLPGGKGGFGSMLRAIGAQIDKTTNRDACRDLSGRRMRDVNNEKNLREWVAKKAERERERERRRKERRERLLAVPIHRFDDPSYHDQKQQVTEGLENALQEGLQKAGASASCSAGPSRKRKADTDSVSKDSIKKACEWLGVNVDDLSDVDFSSDSNSDRGDDDDGGASSGYPGVSSLPTSDTGLHSDSGMGSVSALASGSDEKASTTDTEKDRQADHPTLESDSVTAENSGPESAGSGQVTQPEPSTDETNASKTGSTKTENEEKGNQASANKEAETLLDLESIPSVADLEGYGLDKLKSELMARGLKCGGTLLERANRLFSIKGLTKEQIDPSLYAKAKGKGKNKR